MPLEIYSSVRKAMKENQECTSGDYSLSQYWQDPDYRVSIHEYWIPLENRLVVSGILMVQSSCSLIGLLTEWPVTWLSYHLNMVHFHWSDFRYCDCRWNGMLRHSLGGEVIFFSLHLIVAVSLTLVLCLCVCLVFLPACPPDVGGRQWRQ